MDELECYTQYMQKTDVVNEEPLSCDCTDCYVYNHTGH